ncbi:AAA family ATPase [uncultured Sunxiuqinia sp.]|uniref:ATP-dependent nuclease n=1 Tax=uncultured Sunxiuqinia sp. TaxID=1573825 RepID=UPI0026116776|nr:AAA family ATPase [uncultured Sunxiuqinia sp.]
MILDQKIRVKNYKCFDSTGGGFDKILPINIIIGKNNSGKSSLIDLIQFIVTKNKDFIDTGRDNISPEVLIEHRIKENEIAQAFPQNTSGGGIPALNFFEYGKTFVNKVCTYQLGENGTKKLINVNAEFVNEAKNLFDNLVGTFNPPFTGKRFCNISAERDILPEQTNANIEFAPNGTGATNIVQQIINRTNRDSRLIENELLQELNSIINPDIRFTRILVQLRDNNHWEIFFEDNNKKRIALSKMGSGIKTVLLVLLNLIVRPVVESRKYDSYVFAFEELENNLHPSLQRRLYNYIRNYSEKHSSFFFLTTHSNVVIDAFGTYKNSQLIHVSNDGLKSSSSTALSHNGAKQILNDLGIKASDILQSNGVIWVEGPSDRNYINKWLKILSPGLQEGLHFSIMFYGGRLLSNLSFDFEWFNREVIPLLKINSNAFVVIDRDGKTMHGKINETKKRITSEIGEGNCWITKGREIENYLSDKTITNWLKDKHGVITNFHNEKDTKLEDNIFNSNSKINIKYNLNKTVFSSEIADYIDSGTLEIMDLKNKLDILIDNIKKWNE